jgi:hypothetical protein
MDNGSCHISAPENNDWGDFKSDGEAEACQEGDEADNQTIHKILEDAHSAIYTPGGSTSLGRGLSGSSPQLEAFDERKLVSWADLNDALDPQFRLDPNNHILILSNMIRQIDKATYSADEPRYKCVEFLKKIGTHTLEERILASIELDLRGLIEIRRLSFDTLYECQKAKARRCHEPGVYVHVMYDLDDDNYVGLYVGSSLCISARIKEH